MERSNKANDIQHPQQKFDYLVILDYGKCNTLIACYICIYRKEYFCLTFSLQIMIEAVCDMQRKNWEVIEFPSVILNTKTLKVSKLL